METSIAQDARVFAAMKRAAGALMDTTPDRIRTLTVLVPRPDSDAARTIDPGSGIVTADAGGATVDVYFEGNGYRAANIRTFEDKVLHAAGRLAKAYPTIARGRFPREDFDGVGTFSFSDDWREHRLDITDAAAVARWTAADTNPDVRR